MPENTQVSVLVPVYNVAPFIERCVHTLFKQTFQNIEFIFVNDKSTDNSMTLLNNVLSSYPARIEQVRIIEHERNQGISYTRKTLLSAAQGEYIFWVDSDDFICENAVEIAYNAIIAAKADLLISNSHYLYYGKQKIEKYVQDTSYDGWDYFTGLVNRKRRAAIWAAIAKRALYTDNNVQIMDFSYGEDYFITAQLLYFAKNVAFIDEPFYFYNKINESSYTAGKKQEFHFQSIIRLLNSLDKFFQDNNATEQYHIILLKAKIVERNNLLLHTTPTLRRKYADLYEKETKSFQNALPFTAWQRFLLKPIESRHFLIADGLLIFAKIVRALFGIQF
ncbi:MAG: glycosyltransferase [Paludibacter sp.]|nr:glycosyltransferase [Paludibacter sp.]